MNLFSDEVRRNPYDFYAQARLAHPVLHDPRTDSYMLFDYDSVRRALTDPDAFSSEVSPPPARTYEWLVFADPPRHTRLRGLISRAFTPRAVAGLEGRIRELARELLDPHAGDFDLAVDYAVPLPLLVIAELLGAPAHDLPRFRHWSDVILQLSYSLGGGPEAEQALSAFAQVHQEMEGYVAELIEDRRARPREDLLSALVAAEVEGERLKPQEILGFFQLLLIAGHETTTNLINNAVLCWVEFPDQLQRLRQARELLPSAIEEVLRYRSPVQAMWRVTRREVELAGHTIPAYRMVMPMIGSANRDPKQFNDPDRFDVARDPNPHIAFGHGIHFCLGAALSRLEARLALGELLDRWQHFELAPAQPWQPRRALHVHGPTSLPVRFR